MFVTDSGTTCDAMALAVTDHCSGRLSQQQTGGYSRWQRRSQKTSRSPTCGSTGRSKSATPSPSSHIHSGPSTQPPTLGGMGRVVAYGLWCGDPAWLGMLHGSTVH